MLQAYTLTTAEADRPALAVAEIQGQLAALPLCEHTVGILACHYDFVKYGVVQALGQALPFPLVGITTFYQATPAAAGLFQLTITVLTSSQVRFALACSAGAEAPCDPAEKIRQTYRRAFEQYGERPALVLSFLSARRPISGDEYLRRLDEASGGVPSFGVVDSGEEEAGTNTHILCGEQALRVGVALLLLVGPLQARTCLGKPAQAQLLSLNATVTNAEGTLVRQLNGQPAAAYLEKNCVALEAGEGIIAALPFYCRMPGDRTFVARLVRAVRADGSLEFMSEVPQGSLLRVGTATPADILAESAAAMRQAVAGSPNAAVFLVAACVGRLITLGLDPTAEMDHITAAIPAGKGYLACYVDGEICPVEGEDGPANRYHNNSFIVLALG